MFRILIITISLKRLSNLKKCYLWTKNNKIQPSGLKSKGMLTLPHNDEEHVGGGPKALTPTWNFTTDAKSGCIRITHCHDLQGDRRIGVRPNFPSRSMTQFNCQAIKAEVTNQGYKMNPIVFSLKK